MNNNSPKLLRYWVAINLNLLLCLLLCLSLIHPRLLFADAGDKAGDLDTSFGINGVVTSSPGTLNVFNDQAESIIQQRDGKLVVAGTTQNSLNSDVTLARYLRDGALDPDFGEDGIVSTPLAGGNDYAYALIQQADRKLLVAGRYQNGKKLYMALLRYNKDGTPDTGFGNDGIVTVAPGISTSAIYGLVQQSDGKIVAAGYSTSEGTSFDFALLRFNTNGSLDNSFGEGGLVTTDASSSLDLAYSLIEQTDGKLVVAGISRVSGNFDVALARYHSDGSLDTSFNEDGIVTTAAGSGSDYAYGLIQQYDGKLVVTGYSKTENGNEFTTIRYTSDGYLDDSFADDGIAIHNSGSDSIAYDLSQQENSKLVIAGGNGSDMTLLRYNLDGSLDTSFGVDGFVTTSISDDEDIAYSLVKQSDQKLVVAGFSSSEVYTDIALARYSVDGELDEEFGINGAVTTAVGVAEDYGKAVIEQNDGTIVVAGETVTDITREMVLMRYKSDGSVDTSFNNGVAVTTNLSELGSNLNSLIQQRNSKLVVAGSVNNEGQSNFAVLRHQTNGELDKTFGEDGIVTLAIGIGGSTAESLIQQSDLKLVVVGNSRTDSYLSVVTLARLLKNGELDPDFGDNGIVVTPVGSYRSYATDVVQQDDGKILIVGHVDNGDDFDALLVRYNTNGTLDTEFGVDGIVTTPVGISWDYLYSVVLQPGGKIIAAGDSNANVNSNLDYTILRFNSDGTLDPSFGDGGIVVTPIGEDERDDYVSDLILQDDGKLVVSGSTYVSNNINTTLARYNNDGSLDNNFGMDGIKKLDSLRGSFAQGLIQLQDGDLLTVGHTTSPYEFHLARFLSEEKNDFQQRVVVEEFADLEIVEEEELPLEEEFAEPEIVNEQEDFAEPEIVIEEAMEEVTDDIQEEVLDTDLDNEEESNTVVEDNQEQDANSDANGSLSYYYLLLLILLNARYLRTKRPKIR